MKPSSISRIASSACTISASAASRGPVSATVIAARTALWTVCPGPYPRGLGAPRVVHRTLRPRLQAGASEGQCLLHQPDVAHLLRRGGCRSRDCPGAVIVGKVRPVRSRPGAGDGGKRSGARGDREGSGGGGGMMQGALDNVSLPEFEGLTRNLYEQSDVVGGRGITARRLQRFIENHVRMKFSGASRNAKIAQERFGAVGRPFDGLAEMKSILRVAESGAQFDVFGAEPIETT